MARPFDFQEGPLDTYSGNHGEFPALKDEFADLESDLHEEEEIRRGRRSGTRSPVFRRPPARPPVRPIRPIRPWRTTPSIGIHPWIIQPVPPLPFPPEPPVAARPMGEPTAGAQPVDSDASGHEGSEYVRWVQDSLNRILGLRLPLDGIMGPDIRSAIRSFQTREGLAVSGIVGPDTEQALVARGTPSPPHPSRTTPVAAPDDREDFESGLSNLEFEDKAKQILYFKDSARLRSVSLAPTKLLTIEPSWPSIRKAIARTYNRLGGLMTALARETRIDVHSALAVWYIESGGRRHTPNRAIIRFENHLLYRSWGITNATPYNAHFKHGGHNGEPGKAWQNHKFRENVEEPFQKVHTSQEQEYRVLNLASRLAGEDPALRSISIGGPQILVGNCRLIGYSSPKHMYEAFQASERYHVLGFFDFCRHRKAPRKGDLLSHLRNHGWDRFAHYYNGPGQTAKYGSRIRNAYEHAINIIA